MNTRIRIMSVFAALGCLAGTADAEENGISNRKRPAVAVARNGRAATTIVRSEKADWRAELWQRLSNN